MPFAPGIGGASAETTEDYSGRADPGSGEGRAAGGAARGKPFPLRHRSKRVTIALPPVL